MPAGFPNAWIVAVRQETRMIVTRGFTGKRRTHGVAKERVPPGQFVTPEFPVRAAGRTRHGRVAAHSNEASLAVDQYRLAAPMVLGDALRQTAGFDALSD
jgi:hypothetical protein